MSKYAPLVDYLNEQRNDSVTVSFDDIACIIGGTLPASARLYPAWWGNDTNGRHVNANEWLNAGWKVESVSLDEERVTFVHRDEEQRDSPDQTPALI